MEQSRFECMICNASRASAKQLIVVTIFCAWIALEIPLDVLSTSPRLKALTDFMSSIFPVIQHYAQTSNFPEVTQLYMSLMLAAFPFGFIAPLCTLSKDKRLFVPIQSLDTGDYPMGRYIMSCFFMTLLIPGLVYFHWFVNPGFDVWGFHFHESRVALAIFGVSITLAIPFLMGVFVHFVVRFYFGMKSNSN